MSAPPALMWRTSQREVFCTGRKSRNLSGIPLGPELKPSATDRSCGKMEDLGKSHGGDQGIDFFVRMNGSPSLPAQLKDRDCLPQSIVIRRRSSWTWAITGWVQIMDCTFEYQPVVLPKPGMLNQLNVKRLWFWNRQTRCCK